MEVSQRTRSGAIWEGVQFDKVRQLRLELLYYSCKLPPSLDYYTCQLPLAMHPRWPPFSSNVTSVLPSRLDSERSGGGPPYFISKDQLKLFDDENS